MNKKWIVGALLVAALAIPAAVRAHEGHAHKIMGTVTALRDKSGDMKTPDGKTVTVILNAKTTFLRGKQKVDAASIRVGERMVAEVASEKEMIATSVTLAAAVPTAANR